MSPLSFLRVRGTNGRIPPSQPLLQPGPRAGGVENLRGSEHIADRSQRAQRKAFRLPMLEQADPLARLLTGSRQPVALRGRVSEEVVRVFKAPQAASGPRVAIEDGERDVAVFALRSPHEIKVIQRQARAPQVQIRSDHLPRVQPGPGRVAAVSAAVGIDSEVARIRVFRRRRHEVLEHGSFHAGADFRIGDAANRFGFVGRCLRGA